MKYKQYSIEQESNGSWTAVDYSAGINPLIEHQETAQDCINYIDQINREAFVENALLKLTGEVTITIDDECGACAYGDPDDDCEVCCGDITYKRQILVPQETIESILKSAVETTIF